MNRSEQVDKIKRRIGLPHDESSEVLADLFDDLLVYALSFCHVDNIDDTPKANVILAIVCESTAALYNQRGNEGTTGYSTGGQSATYEQVHTAMRDKLVGSGCRWWR